MWDVIERANARDGKQAVKFSEEAVVCVMIKTEINDQKARVHAEMQVPDLLLYMADENDKMDLEFHLEEADSQNQDDTIEENQRTKRTKTQSK